MTSDRRDREAGPGAVDAFRVLAADPEPPAGAPDDPQPLPRLPPRPLVSPAPLNPTRAEPAAFAIPEQLAIVPRAPREHSVVPVGARTSFDIDEYVEPELLRMRAWNRAIVISRVAAFAWAVAVAVSVFVVRSRAQDGVDDGSEVTVVGRVGVPVAALLLVIGWVWSDRRARNIALLQGRLPGRLRCATAWLAPGVLAVLLAIAIVPLEPGELLDVRPPIIVAVFVAAMWRPYALIRRILATLIRTRSDALIGTAALLDLAGFGLLWWQLTTWPSVVTADASGSVDSMIGVGLAAAATLGANVVVWLYLLRAVDGGEAHRLASLQTRYEHRALRLRGIDPTDPDVWWALVQRRVARQRALEQTTPGHSIAANPETLVQRVRAEHPVAFNRLGRDGSAELVDRLRAQLASALQLPSDDTSAGRADARAASDERGSALNGRLRPDDPLASLKQRLGLVTGDADRGPQDALRRLLDQASLVQVEAALASRSTAEPEEEEAPAVRLVPPRLVVLEACRYLTILAFAATAGTALWLVRETLDGRLGAAGQLPGGVVEDIDIARRAFVTSYTIALALVPLWASVVSSHARRTGVWGTRERRLLWMFALSAAIAATSFALDGTVRGTTSLLLQIPALALAIWSAQTVVPVARWYGLSSLRLTGWTFGAAVLLASSWIGQLQRPVEATDSQQVMAFFAVAVAIVAGVVVVAMALDSADLEDAIRLSPELAVPARSRRR